MANLAAHFAVSESQIAEHPREPRREQRIASAFRIEVCGFNRYGRFFTERTLTSNISDGGCQLSLHVEVEKDSVVALESSNTEMAANSTRARSCSRLREWSRKRLVGRSVCQGCSRCPCGALNP